MDDNLQIAVELGKQLLEKNTELELEYNRLKDENEKLSMKLEEYKQRRKGVLDEREEATIKVMSLEEELKSAQQLHTLATSQLKLRILHLNNQIESMQAEISSLNESEQQLIEENRKLKEQVHNDTFNLSVQNASKKLASSMDNSVKKKYDEEISQLRAKIKDFQLISQNNKDLNLKVKQLTEENEKLAEKNAENEELSKAMSSLAKANSVYQQELREYKDLIKESRLSYTTLKAKYDDAIAQDNITSTSTLNNSIDYEIKEDKKSKNRILNRLNSLTSIDKIPQPEPQKEVANPILKEEPVTIEIKKEQIKEEIIEEIKEEIKEDIKEEIIEEIIEEIKEEIKEEVKDEIVEDIKQEIKEEITEETKVEVKELIKEEQEIKEVITTRSIGVQAIIEIPLPQIINELEIIPDDFMDKLKNANNRISTPDDNVISEVSTPGDNENSFIQLSLEEFNSIDRKIKLLTLTLAQSQKDKRVFIDTIKRLHVQMQSLQSEYNNNLQAKNNKPKVPKKNKEIELQVLSKITEFRDRLSYAQKSVHSKKMKNLLKNDEINIITKTVIDSVIQNVKNLIEVECDPKIQGEDADEWIKQIYELLLDNAELNLSNLRVQNHLREVKERYNALIIEYNKEKLPKAQRKWWHFGK